MNFIFDTVYERFDEIVRGPSIDLGAVTIFDPWAVGLICLCAVGRRDKYGKKILWPKDSDAKNYLGKTGLSNFTKAIGYDGSSIGEVDDRNVQKITHSLFRDDFNARLSKIKSMFQSFGMGNEDDINRATVLVGELGNNVFDHNEGAWPTEIRGAVILGQNYPQEKKIEMVVADPGIGFRQSLRTVDPDLTDVEAIKLGLKGRTGRIGEERGNGLRLIQDWVINKFNGAVRIHSGGGLVVVDEGGVRSKSVVGVLGTLAGFVIRYN